MSVEHVHTGTTRSDVVTTTAVDATATISKRPMLDSIAAARRFVRAFVRNTQNGDGGLAELTAVVELHRETGTAVDEIARHLLAADDCSYREIGVALGITPQAAAKRYPGASALPAGGQRSWLR